MIELGLKCLQVILFLLSLFYSGKEIKIEKEEHTFGVIVSNQY